MKVSYRWLQDYIDAPLPSPEKVAEALTMRSFEVEGMEKVGADTVLDIAVLPNRAHDCLSHIGIAREVALLFNLPLKPPSFIFAGDASVSTTEATALTMPEGVPIRRVLKRLAVDVQIKESPEWLKEKLLAVGQRPINNIVDATNFVMFETGQPVHAFDFDKISGGALKKVSIRMAKPREKILTLDDKEYTLDDTMVVIADAEKALDIAGIKGGASSGIDENTTRVLLSACTFHPTNIRKTSRKLGLVTDASKRFEQELSPILAERAISRLAEMIADVAGAKVAADTLDWYPRPRHPYIVGVSTKEVNDLLGTATTDVDIEEILTRLGFEWKKMRPIDEMLTLAPTLVGAKYAYGASVSYDAPRCFDCSSLVAYLFSQSGVALPRMTADQYVFGESIEKEALRPGDVVFSRNRNGNVAHEQTFTLVADGRTITQDTLQKTSKEFMRGTAIDGGLDHNGVYLGDGKIIHAARQNGGIIIEPLETSTFFEDVVGYRRMLSSDDERYAVTVPPERLDLHSGSGFMTSGNAADIIEEIGRVYGYENISAMELPPAEKPKVDKIFYYTNKIRDILVAEGFSEVMTYAFKDKGDIELANPLAEDKKLLRASLRAGLMESLEMNKKNAPLVGSPVRVFEIGTVFGKSGEYMELGIVSEDEADVRVAFDLISEALDAPAAHSNGFLNLTDYTSKLPEPTSHETLDQKTYDISSKIYDISYKPFSPYPFVLRDIAVWVPEGVESHQVIKSIKESAGEWLVRLDLFDEYRKESEGKVSYAFHLVFQSREKTLSDEEVNTVMEKVTSAVVEKGWTVR